MESWVHIPSSASRSLVVSEWEEGISGPFSMGPETPNGPEGHRPAQTSPAAVQGWALIWDPQPAPLSVQSELSQTCCPGCVSLFRLNCCLLPHKNTPEFLVPSHSSCTSTGLWTTQGLGASQVSRHRTAMAKSP